MRKLTMSISQGAAANKSGQSLERDVEAVLNSFGIDFQKEVKFTNTYFNKNARMDFLVGDLAIECKRQMVGGTADQKFPFVFNDLQLFPCARGLVIIDGDHYKKREGIHKYLDSKKSDTFDWCFFDNFVDWLEVNL